ncbi:hypothetical protein M8369_31330 [Klebsiella pneumoniae]|nr:hypothetical protein [Klebsiella pneumoniae]
MGEISVKTGNNARNGGKNSLNRLIRCVCGKKIGPDPRNFNQRVSLGRNDLLIRTFPKPVSTNATTANQAILNKLRASTQTVAPARAQTQHVVPNKSSTHYVAPTRTSASQPVQNIPSPANTSKQQTSQKNIVTKILKWLLG